MTSELETIASWDRFRARADDPRRSLQPCRLAGELLPPAAARVEPLLLLDQARRHPAARILSQRPGRQLDIAAVAAERIRAAPLDEVAADPHLHISLFDLDVLCAPGGALHQLDHEALRPFAASWREAGYTYDKAWPVIFICGSASATNYHFDPMATLPWHLFGAKRFHGLKDPARWCPPAVIGEFARSGAWPTRPEGIVTEDVLVHDNAVGDLLWIPQQVPHWVDAGSFSATLTFTFPGLRHVGRSAAMPLRSATLHPSEILT